MAKKRKAGRPKGSGFDLSGFLIDMAEEICRRRFRSERDAARDTLEHYRERVSVRHLTRVYAGRRRQLEIGAMRRLVTWAGVQACGPDEWEALLRHTERLAADNPRLMELAGELYPNVWRHFRHLPFPLHRLYPQELLDLLREAGFEPPG